MLEFSFSWEPFLVIIIIIYFSPGLLFKFWMLFTNLLRFTPFLLSTHWDLIKQFILMDLKMVINYNRIFEIFSTIYEVHEREQYAKISIEFRYTLKNHSSKNLQFIWFSNIDNLNISMQDDEIQIKWTGESAAKTVCGNCIVFPL